MSGVVDTSQLFITFERSSTIVSARPLQPFPCCCPSDPFPSLFVLSDDDGANTLSGNCSPSPSPNSLWRQPRSFLFSSRAPVVVVFSGGGGGAETKIVRLLITLQHELFSAIAYCTIPTCHNLYTSTTPLRQHTKSPPLENL